MARVYTFDVYVGGYIEEVDVTAENLEEAQRLAKIEADSLYAPQDYELKLINTGGSGGWVTMG